MGEAALSVSSLVGSVRNLETQRLKTPQAGPVSSYAASSYLYILLIA